MDYVLKTWRDPYGGGFNTTTARQVPLKEGLTVLVGCNGAGKSTFLQNLKDQAEREKLPVLSYDNLSDGGSSSYGEMLWNGDYEFLGMQMSSSEGENISLQMARMAGYLHEFLVTGDTPKAKKRKKWDRIFRGLEEGKKEEMEPPVPNKRFLLLDAVDSGYSVDNVVSLKEDLFQVVLEDAKKEDIELYIVIAANEYELARGESCMDVMNGKYLTFRDYEDYRKFILNSRKRKEKRMEAADKKMEKIRQKQSQEEETKNRHGRPKRKGWDD